MVLGCPHWDPKDSRKVATRDLAQCSGPREGCWLLVVLNPSQTEGIEVSTHPMLGTL